MVYFHGGGFSSGSAAYSEKGPHYFMEYDVLIVTVNYRLGPWGKLFFFNIHKQGVNSIFM